MSQWEREDTTVILTRRLILYLFRSPIISAPPVSCWVFQVLGQSCVTSHWILMSGVKYCRAGEEEVVVGNHCTIWWRGHWEVWMNESTDLCKLKNSSIVCCFKSLISWNQRVDILGTHHVSSLDNTDSPLILWSDWWEVSDYESLQNYPWNIVWRIWRHCASCDFNFENC